MRWVPVAALLLVLLVASCGGSTFANDGRLRVVAAENFWGSIAAQLGGNRVQVNSVVHSPATDPHDYEPPAQDARALAEAQLVLVNGVGYDPWAPKLIDANPVSDRVVITAGDVAGVHKGGNPHLWYSLPVVQRMIDAITAGYKKLDPGHAAYFDAQRTRFRSDALAGYEALIAQIRSRYAGVAVGASESVFTPLARSLRLKLITPEGLLNAVSEGADPTAAAKTEADRQITGRRIKTWVYNSQNATPDVKRLTAEARARGIPVATVTETLTPESATFQQWQSGQLRELARALANETGR